MFFNGLHFGVEVPGVGVAQSEKFSWHVEVGTRNASAADDGFCELVTRSFFSSEQVARKDLDGRHGGNAFDDIAA